MTNPIPAGGGRRAGDGLKRAIDLALVVVTAPAWVALLALVGILVRIVHGAPVFFVQERAGRLARPFRMVKFRTMTQQVDAAGRLLPDAGRLTPLGRFLRASSLDELPELVNVLWGDMSLVGPRPLLPRYVERYSPRHRRRLDVRPGLTGLAQVAGRNALTWSDRFDLDVEYVERRTLIVDFTILWRTIGAVVLRSGISAEGEATMAEFTGYPSSPGSDKSGTPR